MYRGEKMHHRRFTTLPSVILTLFYDYSLKMGYYEYISRRGVYYDTKAKNTLS